MPDKLSTALPCWWEDPAHEAEVKQMLAPRAKVSLPVFSIDPAPQVRFQWFNMRLGSGWRLP